MSLGDLDITIADGSIALSDIAIIPKPSILDSLRANKSNSRMLVDLRIDEIEMDGFEIRKFLNTGDLEVASFSVDRPQFKMYFIPGRRQRLNNTLVLQQNIEFGIHKG